MVTDGNPTYCGYHIMRKNCHQNGLTVFLDSKWRVSCNAVEYTFTQFFTKSGKC